MRASAAARHSSSIVCDCVSGYQYRRDSCRRCGGERTEEAAAATSTIRINGLSPQATEDDLKCLVMPHGVACSIRVVRNRVTQAPRGLAYITFATSNDAQAALDAIHATVPPGHSAPIIVNFAVDRYPPRALASQAVEAAQAMSSYSKPSVSKAAKTEGEWKPRVFSLDAMKEEGPDGAGADAAGDGAPNAAAVAAPGFVYDASSGYYYDAESGYYYDANSQLYYHPNTESWYRHNAETGEYDVIPADGSATAATPMDADDVEPPGIGMASTNAVVAPAAEAAVIGASPELNPKAVHAQAASLGSQSPVRQTLVSSVSAPAATIQQAKTVTRSPTGASAGKATANAPAAKPATKAKEDTSMVNAWLKRKAEEQRKAAREFLKPQSEKPQSDVPPPSTAQPQEDRTPQKLGESGVDGEVKLAGGIVRQKVYSGAVGYPMGGDQVLAEASPQVAGDVIVKAVAGGVIRGKIYKRK